MTRSNKEIKKEDFAETGIHSHTHEYLVDERINWYCKSISILKIRKNLTFFHPFGEYSNDFKNNKDLVSNML